MLSPIHSPISIHPHPHNPPLPKGGKKFSWDLGEKATHIISQMLSITNRRLSNDRHVHLAVDQRRQHFRVVDDAEHGEAVVAWGDLEVEDGGVADDCVDAFDGDGEGEGYVALGGGVSIFFPHSFFFFFFEGVLEMGWKGWGERSLPSRWS